jgi:hypothetical protein
MIQRYRILANGKVIPSDSGGYCAYADCASLTQQVAALRKALELSGKALTDARVIILQSNAPYQDEVLGDISDAQDAAKAALQLTSDGEKG